MAISYPLDLPTHTGIQSISFRARNVVSVSRSPFSMAQQVVAHAGMCWEADLTLPPMNEANAEKWTGWLNALRGQYGTFLLGPPLADSPQGTATSLTITGSAGDTSVTADVNSGTATLLRGDYFSLGSGASTRLYQVTLDKTGDGTLEIWPSLRAAASTATGDLTYPKSRFRLASNEQNWDISPDGFYNISFSAIEAI